LSNLLFLQVKPSWVSTELAALAAAHAAGRLPHALLLHEAPGAGGEWLARWVAQLVLCQRAGEAPCGSCAGCARVIAGQHPDLLLLQPTEDSQQIRIEQVRELAQELALTSHQGGYKVAILSPADALNRFAANALLKTLEEPPPQTVLLLVATQPSRLPATILSRCQRVRVRAPTRAQGVSWLQATRGDGDWNAVLDTLGEAPMLAAQADPQAIVQIAAEVRRTLDEAASGGADPVASAERWARADLPLRLRCIENWLTERIRDHFGGHAFFTELRAGPHLPRAVAVLNIRELFGLADSVRELKASLEAPINRGLALETVLRQLDRTAGATSPSRR